MKFPKVRNNSEFHNYSENSENVYTILRILNTKRPKLKTTCKAQIPIDVCCLKPGLRPDRWLFLEQYNLSETSHGLICDLSKTCFKPDANFLIDATEPTYFCNLFHFFGIMADDDDDEVIASSAAVLFCALAYLFKCNKRQHIALNSEETTVRCVQHVATRLNHKRWSAMDALPSNGQRDLWRTASADWANDYLLVGCREKSARLSFSIFHCFYLAQTCFRQKVADMSQTC